MPNIVVYDPETKLYYNKYVKKSSIELTKLHKLKLAQILPIVKSKKVLSMITPASIAKKFETQKDSNYYYKDYTIKNIGHKIYAIYEDEEEPIYKSALFESVECESYFLDNGVWLGFFSIHTDFVGSKETFHPIPLNMVETLSNLISLSYTDKNLDNYIQKNKNKILEVYRYIALYSEEDKKNFLGALSKIPIISDVKEYEDISGINISFHDDVVEYYKLNVATKEVLEKILIVGKILNEKEALSDVVDEIKLQPKIKKKI